MIKEYLKNLPVNFQELKLINMKSELFVVAYLANGQTFEANNYKELEKNIVNFYSEIDAPSFSGINELAYADDDICTFQDNEKLESLIAKTKQDRWENDGSDLSRDYEFNLI